MTSFSLKILACFCMLIDHIGFCFFPDIIIFRIIGRIAFPVFAFQTAIGFEKTHNKEKHILKMLLFTIISQIPFYLFLKIGAGVVSNKLNVGATLTLGLLVLYSLYRIKKPLLKYLIAISIIVISILVPMDYGWYGVISVLIFYVFRQEKIAQGISYAILLIRYSMIKNTLFDMPALYSLIPILLYNGKKGHESKLVFYLFYPVHMLVLIGIKLIL